MRFFGPDEAGTLENNVDGDALELSPDDLRAVEERAAALRDLLDTKDLAKYKVELLLDRRKSREGGYPGALMVWKSGSAMGGGGDDAVYPCPDSKCSGYIDANHISTISKSAFCPKCARAWKQSDLNEIRMFFLPPERWAYVLAKEFIRTGCLADVYMKIIRSDVRVLEPQHHMPNADELTRIRGDRDLVMYRLQDIIKDVNAGSSIEARMKALLTA